MSATPADAKVTGSSKNDQSSVKIGDLPSEVLGHIFEFISYPFIQDVLLVCKNWYEIATRNKNLQDQEKVVCYKDFTSELLDTFLKSKREIRHLCLADNPIPWQKYYKDSKWNISYTRNLQFWNRFGPELKSLSIRSCEFVYDELLLIVSRCSKLKSLELSDFAVTYRFSEGPIKNKPTSAETEFWDIISNLESASIKVTDMSFDFEALFDALSKAPKLRSFRVVLILKDDTTEEEYLSPYHLAHFVQKIADRCLFDLHILAPPGYGANILNHIIQIPDLKIRSLSIDADFPMELPLYLKSLRVLDVRSELINNDRLKLICTELQELRSLNLALDDTVYPYPFYLLPKLTSLSLTVCDFYGSNIDEFLVDGLCSKEDTVLRELNLNLDCAPDTIVQLAKTHPSLNYLRLLVRQGVTDTSVQAIFKYLVSLKSLSLSSDKLTDAGLSGESIAHSRDTGYGIARLKNLWRLNLKICKSVKGTPFSSGLTLPQLHHLCLDADSFSEEALLAVVKNHPRIEYLNLSNGVFTNELVEAMVFNLHRLRYVFSFDDRGTSEECIKALKQHCKLVKIRPYETSDDYYDIDYCNVGDTDDSD